MAKPLTLPPLSNIQVTELRHLSETAPNAKRRLRAQLVLLAQPGRSVAALVFRSRYTVERALNRFLQGGIAALPPRQAPRMTPTVTPEWKAALWRGIDLHLPTVAVPSANWTTHLRASSLAPKTHMMVSAETVRLYLRDAGYVCKRPTWPLTPMFKGLC